jgi:hypothetical protein
MFVKDIPLQKIYVDFFFVVDHVFGLWISPEICPNHHYLGVTNLRYVLFKADFPALLYFFCEFSMYFFKYENPNKNTACVYFTLTIALDRNYTSVKVKQNCISNLLFIYVSPDSAMILSSHFPYRKINYYLQVVNE